MRHRGAKVSTRSDVPNEQAIKQTTKQATKQANEQTGTSGLTILVVDDNPDVVETTSMLLQAWGHRTVNAHDGASGLALVAAEAPHAVLMDLGMPRIDGFEMARRIRELPGGKNVRLIAMSGWGQPADRERALAAGIDEHLVKPVDPTRLRELLNRIAKTRTNRGD